MIVDEFRTLTGQVPMLPRYLLGYVQSKERYANPHDIDSVLTRFRTSNIPIDVIVQDWNYWNPSWWGHKKFYEKSFCLFCCKKYHHPKDGDILWTYLTAWD